MFRSCAVVSRTTNRNQPDEVISDYRLLDCANGDNKHLSLRLVFWIPWEYGNFVRTWIKV
jgi:hypothetical protein